MAKVPGSSAWMSSSSNINNTNSGKQDDNVTGVGRDWNKRVGHNININITERQENNPRNITESQEKNPRNITESQEKNPCNITESQENNPRNISEEDSGNLALKKARRSFQKSTNFYDVARKVARRCAGHPRVLIAGVLIAGVLIAGVFMLKQFMLKQKKLSDDGKVAVDASLSATGGNDRSWPSPSGDFALGFRPLENSDLFLLCIWYAKIPIQTVVWYANGDKPAPKGSIVKLTANNGLVLTSPQGEPLWKSDQTTAGVVAHGVMHDTGNFVLEDDKSKSLWETFKNPTDTMLPGQIIEKGGKLSSRQSETNYTRGRFQLDFQQDGNLVFNQLDFQQDGNPVYSDKKPFCSTSTTNGNVTDSEGKQLVFDDSGNFYILRVNGGKFKFTAEERPASDNYLRSTLNFDGVLAQYFLPKSFVGKATWTALWSEPKKVDSGAGDCWDKCSNCYLTADQGRTCKC